MDDFKKGPGQNGNDFDDIEIIDATDSEVIEVVDPYESEVIEVNVQKDNIVKKNSAPHVAQAPTKKIMDADFDMFNPSTTVILKKAPKDDKKDEGKKEEKKVEVKPVSVPPVKAVKEPEAKPETPKKPEAKPVAPETKKFVATPPTGKIKDITPEPAPAPVVKGEGEFKATPPKGKIIVPESIDVGGSTTQILKKAEPKADEKKESKQENKPVAGTKPAAAPTPAPKAAPNKKYDDLNLDEFDDLPPVDYTAKAKPKTVNTSLAGAKPAAKSAAKPSSGANPLFATGGDEEPEKPKSFMDQVKGGYITIAGKEIPVKGIAIGLGALIAVILLFVIFSGGGREKINMNKYVEVTFEGFSGSAKPVVNIDYEKIAAEMGDKVKISSSKTLEDLIREDVSYSFDKSENLTNGDSINLTWEFKESFEKDTNATLIGAKKNVKVKDIPEAVSGYDLFANVSCTFSGYSGEGTLTFTASDEKFPELIYTADKTEGILNDDEITISVSVEGVDDVEAYLKSKGYSVNGVSTKVKASGLAEYDIYDIFANANVTFSGFDGVGVATVTGNTGFDNISYSLENAENLSNGDKAVVKLVSTGDMTVQQIVHASHYSITSESKEFEVKGLRETKDYDAFSQLEYRYTGIAPDGILSIDPSGVSVAELEFSADKISGLSNGDSVTITISCSDGSDPEKVCLTSGYKLKAVTKTITVDGLAYYLNTVNDINKFSENALDSNCRKIIDNVRAGLLDERIIKDISLSSIYVQYPKSDDVTLSYNPSMGGDIHNRLYMVYEISIKDGAAEFKYYWPIQFANVTVGRDGMLYVDTTAYIAALASFEVSGRTYYGYMQMSEFKDSCINNNLDVYSFDNK